jgi:formylglycine-generating enzyme required for sulfatase activity/tRNA A-37 threonylcarbamoyl transferase component Bud32
MRYCRNPACPHPENPDSNQLCHGCGLDLTLTPLFRNRYRVMKVLGQGSFGRTYGALDLDCMNRPCVIKKFIARAEGETLQKAQQLFSQEAQRLYELDHPQIPQLYAYFEQDDSLYLVQEFIEGQNLLKIFKSQGYFNEKQILAILKEILPVLDYIHEHGVLHRDIKPENIMRRLPSDKNVKKGNLVLIDFGGAKQTTGTSLTGMGTAIYTPGYAAMEHMMGRPTKASDIYSLGVTCIRLLTGCLSTGTAAKVAEDELYDVHHARWRWREKVKEKNIFVGEQLGLVLDKMLEPFLQTRYQGASEVLAGLAPRRSLPPDAANSAHKTMFIEDPAAEIAKELQQVNTLNKFQFQVITVNAKGEEKESKSIEAQYLNEDLGKGIFLEMVSIPGGEFLFGSPPETKHKTAYELIQQVVKVSPFFISKYPVTQNQWEAIMNNNPSRFKGGNRPVEQVSWFDAITFCQKLAAKTGKQYRLPTETEWEYACRGGTTTPFHFGETITTDLANYDGNCAYGNGSKGRYRQKTINVGSFSPNAYGLYDFHGNTREWCANIWETTYDGQEIIITDANDLRLRSVRGGSWADHPLYCRCSTRYGLEPNTKNFIIGFRVVYVVV